MRVRGKVEYLGTTWAGWQVQPGQHTIQGDIEKALEIVIGAPVRVLAAGRTDSGVHATGQVIAFDIPAELELGRLCRSINALTDASVSVAELAPVNDAFDPRRHALSRTYEYTILNARPPSPFLLDRCWHLHAPLDLALLQRLAAMVVGEHDFTAFRAMDCMSPSTERYVIESTWSRTGHVLTYRVTANAFLKQMVRTLVGTMVDVAINRLPEAAFAELLDGASRTQAGRTAPPGGLALVHVAYPPEFD